MRGGGECRWARFFCFENILSRNSAGLDADDLMKESDLTWIFFCLSLAGPGAASGYLLKEKENMPTRRNLAESGLEQVHTAALLCHAGRPQKSVNI